MDALNYNLFPKIKRFLKQTWLATFKTYFITIRFHQPVEKIHGRISKFFRDRFQTDVVGSIPVDNFVFVNNIVKGPIF